MLSLPPKIKILSILAKKISKIETKLSRTVLFHRKTTVCLKYFGQDCRFIKAELKSDSSDLSDSLDLEAEPEHNTAN